MSSPATIKDVAAHAGASVGTVSRYLNGFKCGAERSLRIAAAIRELNYVPNLHARAVRSLNSRCIGILLGSISSRNCLWIQTLIFSLIHQISEAGFRSFIQIIDENDPAEASALVAGNCDALIPIGHFSSSFFERISKYNIPAVTYWENIPASAGITIPVALHGVMDELARYLTSLGHRRIGIISNTFEINRQKAECFLSVIKKYVPDFDETLLESRHSSADYGQYGADCTAALLERHPDISALFYLSDSFLLGGISELHRRNLNYPGDISVVSFDNSQICTVLVPTVTCIGFDYDVLGRRLVEAVISRIKDKNKITVPELPPELFLRDSTGEKKKG